MPIIGDFANGLVGDLESYAICEHRERASLAVNWDFEDNGYFVIFQSIKTWAEQLCQSREVWEFENIWILNYDQLC